MRSNGTESRIQRLSGRQDGLSARHGLPLLPQHLPSPEHIKNEPAMGHEETFRSALHFKLDADLADHRETKALIEPSSRVIL